MPAFKVEEFLPTCIKSILTQTYSNLEIILVDDGSPDQCGFFCDEFAKQDQRIHVIHQKNQGLSSARNSALDLATGEYICFVDGDDFLLPKHIENLFNSLIKYNAELSACAMVEFFPNGEIQILYLSKIECVLESQQSIQDLLYRCGMGFSVCNKLFKHSLFDELRFPIGMLFEDYAIIVPLFYRCQRLVWGTGISYYYRNRSGSITNSGYSEPMLDILHHTDNLSLFIEKHLPQSKLATECVSAYACFTLLQRLVSSKGYCKNTARMLASRIKKHRKSILLNPFAPLRDKVGVLSLIGGVGTFSLCWKIYTFLRRFLRRLGNK